MLATGLCMAWGEGGSERSPLRATGGDCGAPLRSVPWRELLRDMECWPARSLVASRSLSRRSAITLSLADTSTGLAAPKGLGRFTGLLWAILGEASGDGVVEVLPERGRSSNFRRTKKRPGLLVANSNRVRMMAQGVSLAHIEAEVTWAPRQVYPLNHLPRMIGGADHEQVSHRTAAHLHHHPLLRHPSSPAGNWNFCHVPGALLQRHLRSPLLKWPRVTP